MFAPIIIMILSCIAPYALHASSNQRQNQIDTVDLGRTGKSLYWHLLCRPPHQAAWDAYKKEHHAQDAQERAIRNAKEINAAKAIWPNLATPIYQCRVLNNQGRQFLISQHFCDYGVFARNQALSKQTSLEEAAYVRPSDEIPYGAMLLYPHTASDTYVRKAFIQTQANRRR